MIEGPSLQRCVAAARREVERQSKDRHRREVDIENVVRAILTELDLHGMTNVMKEQRSGRGRDVAENEIVLILAPALYEGCLAVVDRVNSFGIVAKIRVPREASSFSGETYHRFEWGQFRPVGGMLPVQEPGA